MVEYDTPPNSLKNSDASPKVKTMKEKGVEVHSLICNILGVRGACWSFKMGTKTNSQVKVQDEINLHNQERGKLVQIEWKWCDELSRDNLKHKLYMARNLWEEAPLASYSILCASPWGPHPNVTFPRDSQVGDRKDLSNNV
jgi:hypothetical protein